MTTVWSYLPITIHLEQQHTVGDDNSSPLIAISGVYLLNTYTKTYYILAINDIPNVDRFTYKFTATSLMTSTHINWLPLYVCDIRFMNDRSNQRNDFMGFVKGIMSNDQFRFKPHDSTYLSIMSFKIAMTIDVNSKPIIDPSEMLPLVFQDSSTVRVPSKTTIQCCPFSLTNAAIFSSYRIFGSINYRITDSGFLSDTKYMDDIIGGIVTLGHHADNDTTFRRSIGLVAGTLVKTNGDGELLTIISWNNIISTLRLVDIKVEDPSAAEDTHIKEVDTKPASNNKSSSHFERDPIDSTVRISVSTHSGQFWGSGIVLSNDFIITNKHVLKLDNLKHIAIATVHDYQTQLTINDFILIDSPLKGFDLCFIKLHKPISQLIPVRMAETYASEFNSFKIGQAVKSVGYGLFFSRGTIELRPFHSEGFVNSIADLELDEVGVQEKSLLLVSASCWNGSSGGGLFNENNELVGIMTSNGKLSSGEILTNFTLAIPINIIIKCIYMVQNNSPSFDITQKAQDLWSLKNTHESRLIDPITHKL